jgi:hypothetical protein
VTSFRKSLSVVDPFYNVASFCSHAYIEECVTVNASSSHVDVSFLLTFRKLRSRTGDLLQGTSNLAKRRRESKDGTHPISSNGRPGR